MNFYIKVILYKNKIPVLKSNRDFYIKLLYSAKITLLQLFLLPWEPLQLLFQQELPLP